MTILQSAASFKMEKSHPQLFAEWALKTPGAPALTWLDDKGEEMVNVTYSQLEAQVLAVADFLTKKMKLEAGDRCILSFPPGPKFLTAIMACFAAGIIAVPVYPPSPASYKKDMERLSLIANASGAQYAFTSSDYELVIKAVRWKNILTLQGGGAKVTWKAVPDACFNAKPDKKKRLQPYPVGPTDVAFLQFTSGSTGDPKGVMVTHRALSHNIATMQRDLHPSPNAKFVSWMPQYHDFGLIVMMLYPTAHGLHPVITSPFTFLKDPLVWLQMMTKYKPETTASPNFGYTRCVKAWRELPEDKRPHADLSSLRYVFNAAEPIRVNTIKEFQEVFGPYGFGPRTMTPAYGLAEHVVYTGACWSLEEGKPASTLDLVDPDTGFIACMEVGFDPDIEVLMMSIPTDEDETQRPVCDGITGEIWLHSPSVAGGYWARPDATEATFGNQWDGKRWLKTGDLGYVKGGYLYITGRLKDVIIVNGRNYYPQDMEVSVEKSSPLIRPGCTAACQLATGLGDGTLSLPPDRIGIVAEVRKDKLSAEELEDLFTSIRHAVAENHGLQVQNIALVKARTIPKTTSGKIRRATCKERLLSGKGLDIIPGGFFDAGEIVVDKVEYVAPRNELEATIQAAWMSVLDRGKDNPISVTADFFAEGGTSLQVFQVGAAMERALNISIPTSMMHHCRTIESAAEAVNSLLEGGADEGAPEPIPAREWPSAERPLSANQEQMWLLSQTGSGGGSAYNLPVTLRLAHAPNLQTLHKALDLIAARHESLRMHYLPRDDGSVAGVITPAADFHVPLEVVGVSTEEQEAAEMREEAAAPFDLVTGPLIRARMIQRQGQQPVVLMLNLHHAVGDAWSFGVIQIELGQAYTALQAGKQPAWDPLPIQYADFAAWQQELVTSEHGAELRQWWKDYLRSAPSLLQLPQDRPRPTHPTFRCGNIMQTLPSSLMAQVEALAQELKVNTQAVLLAALQVVLLRYSGQEDLVVGVPVAGRDRAETQRLVGYFINPQPVRCVANEDATFGGMTKQASEGTVEALAHSALPLEQVVSAAGVQRAPGINPLFQVLFQYLPKEASFQGKSFLGIPVLPNNEEPRVDHAKMDFVLTMDGPKMSMDYMAELYDHSTMARLLGSFVEQIVQGVAQPNKPVFELSVAGAAERPQLAQFSVGKVELGYMNQALAHEAFAAHAASAPVRPCLVFEGKTLSYGEASARINALANALVALGVKGNTPVGVMLDRCFELPIAFLAAMVAGGCYVPLDPSYPDDRLAGYLEDAGAAVLITQRAHEARAKELGGSGTNWQTIILEEFLAQPGHNTSSPGIKADPENIAYIEFTSGSTGRPKGVMVVHQGLRDFQCFLRDNYELTADDASMMSISINFDPHVTQTFTPLYNGARLVIAKPEGHLDADYMMRLTADEGVSFFFTVPVLGFDYFKSPHVNRCTKLRNMLFGGEPLPMELVKLVEKASPLHVGSWNTYGPTEVTVITTTSCMRSDDPLIHIGTPDTNVHAYIVDSHMQAVPIGVPGELLLSGPRLAAGYVGRADLTAEKFIPNPCLGLVRDSIAPNLIHYFKRAYRTGDLVRWRPDGNIEYLGRIDRQIKINGVRIELGEVEAALGSAPGVEQAVASAVLDNNGTKRLVGYVSPGTVDASAITAHCRELLVPAMVPSVVVVLEAFPLLPNGKVDVKGLPSPDWQAEEFVAPANDLDATVQKIWAQTLNRPEDEPLSMTADFFASGGTSLQVFRVNAALQKALGLASVPATLVHTERTARGVAAALAEMLQGGGSAAEEPITAKAWADSERPLSTSQEQMWLLSLTGGTGAYNVPASIAVARAPDTQALQKALDAVAVRHGVLRMRYSKRPDGTMVGTVAPAANFHVPLEVTTVSSDEELQALLSEEAAGRFDLSTGPLLRVRMIKRQGQEPVVLTLTMHHAVGDAWSMGLLQQDLGLAYAAALAGKKPAWDPLPIQYGDYAAWQQEQVAGEVGQKLKEWWKAYLCGAPSLLQLPLDRPRPTHPTYKAGQTALDLPAGLLDQVEKLARKLKVNAQAVLLAALQVVLLRFSGQDNVVVGVPVAGRDRPETHSLIGYFINTLPVRCVVAEDVTFEDMVKQASKGTVDALAHGALPTEQVVAAAGVHRMPGVNPLFQVLFQYLPDDGTPSSDFLGIPIAPGHVVAELSHAKMDIVLSFGKDKLGADFMSELFDAPTIKRLLGSFIRVLQQAIEVPSVPALAGVLLSEADHQQLVRFSSGLVRTDYHDAPLAHEAFTAHSASAPVRPCLVFEGKTLSYGEASARINALANALVALGVKGNTPVGVMLDRCFELPIAFLAAMVAGGCYVPLDPSYPDDRLAGYLEDANAAVLITQRAHEARAKELGGSGTNWQTFILEEFLAQPGHNTSSPGIKADPENIAYIEFTSGSTGRPKGVMVVHQGLRDFQCFLRDNYELTADDASMMSISINFDPHVTQTFTPLYNGARLVIAKPEGHLDADYMMRLTADEGVSFFFTVPVLGFDYFKSPHVNRCTKLRNMLFGGEPLPMELVKLVEKASPLHVGSWNTYGPTEVTVITTTSCMRSDDPLIHIGTPDTNVHAYIVDSHMQAVPIGVPGELLLSGPRLAAGYVGRADLTAEKFIPNPCLGLVRDSIAPNLIHYFKRAYRTGDLVRWRPDGNIEYLGRIDRQIKINGVRIELGEVEAALGSAPGVEQAVASAVLDNNGTKRLVGYVSPGTVDASAITAHCRELLVPAMVPSVVVVLEAFPLLPNGKVDVKGLPAPDWSAAGAEEYVEPATEAEATVQKIWAQVLNRPEDEPLSVTADFFAAGGTSLQKMRISSMMEDAFSVPVVLADLITRNTVRDMAAFVEEQGKAGRKQVKLVHRTWPDAIRTPSSGQLAMYATCATDVSGIQFNEPAAYVLEGDLDAAALERASNMLLDRHEVLRWRFKLLEGEVVAEVDAAASLQLELLKGGAALPEEEAKKRLKEVTHHAFDLGKAPLMSTTLARLDTPGKFLFLVSIHHIVMDGWSLGRILPDILAFYYSITKGEKPALAPLPFQYADFAAWEQAQLDLASDTFKSLTAYWKEKLARPPELLQLPLDFPRPAESGTAEHSAFFNFELGPAEVKALKDLAASLGASLYALFLGVFRFLLCKYAATDDVLLATTYTLRPGGTEALIGYFLRLLLLRNRLYEGDSIADVIKREMETLNGAIQNGLLPLQDVVRAASLARVPGQNSTFQAVVTWDEEDWVLVSDQGADRLRVNPIFLEELMPKCDITLCVIPQKEKMHVLLSGDGTIFKDETMKRMAGCLQQLLRQIVDRPNTGVFSIVGAAERPQLAQFSVGKVELGYMNQALAHEAFAAHSASAPVRPCLVFEGKTLSYGEASARINALANALVALGVKGNTPVGVMLDRCFELPIAFLAAMVAGGCYVPLDPSYPDDRLAGYLEDANAAVLITQRAHEARAKELGGSGTNWQTFILEEFLAQPGHNTSSPGIKADPENIAYIEFTSGSTGRPKGVMVVHQGLRDFQCFLRDNYELTADDASMMSISINFDPHVTQTFTPLYNGARLVIAKPEGHLDADYMMRLTADEGVSFFFTVPVLGFDYFKSPHVNRCTKLRNMLFGGEPLPMELVKLVEKASPLHVGSWNTYGPTEVTVITTTSCMRSDDPLIHIGTPDTNVHAYIVDSHMQAVPIGVPGELLLSGPRLAAGYVGRADLTAEKFIPNPCLGLVRDSIAPNLIHYFKRAYRTGDLVRWRPDGNIEYLGRIDRQIKINGVRIELGEVEAALSTAPGVEQAVVSAVYDNGGTKRLVGYVTPTMADAANILAHCCARLVPAMVPSVVVVLNVFPLLPNGKVDVKGLPAPDWGTAGAKEYVKEYVASSTELESTIRRVWMQVLGRTEDDPLSVTADFFAAGGTSLQVFRVNALLQKEPGLAAVPTTLIHTERTVRRVAAALSAMQKSGELTAAAQPIIVCKWSSAERPLSASQEQMWLLSQSVGASAYNMPFNIALQHAPDTAALQKALDAVAARHEVLRMHYSQKEDGTVVGIVTPAADFHVPLEVVTAASEAQEEAVLTAEAAAPFALSTGPLLRGRVVKRQGREPVVLALNMHHAVSDGWSMNLLQQELNVAYAAALGGKQPSWDPLPIQYGDYAAWQQKQVAGEAGQKLKDWWRKYLQGAPALLQLSTDRPRPASPTYQPGQLVVDLPAGLLDQVDTLAQELKVNTQAVLLAAMQLVLLRYSGQDDAVVGVPVAGRDRPETQALVGYFINTLPVRCVASEETTFAELANQASKGTVDALAHSTLPLEQVVAAAGAQRTPGVNPLFQVLFQYMPAEAVKAPDAFLGIPVVPDSAEPPLADAKMDLDISVNGETLVVVYMAELFDEATVCRILGSFVRALQQAVRWKAVRVGVCDLLSARDREQMVEFSQGLLRPEFLAGPMAHQSFAEAAAAKPDHPCLIFDGAMMTYGAAAAAVEAVARSLAAQGLEKGTAVGVMLERSFDLPLAFLGILSAGCAFVPLDPSYPEERIQWCLEDAGVGALLTQESLVEKARALTATVKDASWQVMLMSEAIAKGASLPPVPATNLKFDFNSRAYILFTSGSTGRPKGVMIAHGALRDLLNCERDVYSFTREDVSILTHSVAFDGFIPSVFLPLFAGGTVVLTKPGGHADPDYVMSLVAAHNVSFMDVVPVLGREFFRSPEANRAHALRAVAFGGEALTAESVQLAYDSGPNPEMVLYNTYGPTEATVEVTHFATQPGKPITLGPPDPNLHCWIVEPTTMQPVPIGAAGELLLSGPRLALGYVGRADLTADKFIANPCLGLVEDTLLPKMRQHYQRAYKTGDLVRWRGDGTIEYLGRIDRQVKITGVRIELGEVEAALGSAPGIEQAMANAIPDDRGTKRLVGYVTPATADPNAILTHCHRLLLPAMVPSVVVVLEAFPLLPNGKVDVKGLPTPDWSAAGAEEYVAPANDLEATVQKIWMQALGRPEDDPLSVTADFFAAGGTSLQVFRVNAALQKALGLAAIPNTLIHTERTACGVAAALAELHGGGAAAQKAIVPRGWTSTERPLSSNQEQMWIVSRTVGSGAYNMPTSVALSKAPDAQALQKVLDAVAARHEVLRMRYAQQADGTVVGVVVPAADFHVPLEIVTVGAAEEEAELNTEAAAPFNLSTGPLLRALLLKRKGRESVVLTLNMHHAVGDAWSMGLLQQELNVAYAAAVAGKQPAWDPLPIQYGDYAAWQQEQVAGEAGKQLKDWWKTYLRGAPSLLQLPQDRQRPAQPTFKAGQLVVDLPAGLLDQVDALARDKKVNTQAVLLAALQVVLLRYSGQDDVVVGVPVAGRDRPETQALVGYFINTLPVRCIATDDLAFAELANQASKGTVEALAHSALPLEQVVNAAGVQRMSGVNPLFQVLFQYLPAEADATPDSFLGIPVLPGTEEPPLADAKMDIAITSSGSRLHIVYMAELFDEATIRRLVGSFVTTLEQAATQPDVPPHRMELLTAADRLVLAGMSCGIVRPEYLERPVFPDEFAAVVSRHATQCCLVFEGAEMTYADVDAASGAVAAKLVELGIRAEVVVGVMLERSFDLLIAILGVMKAGGCYLPCDPSYPDDRLAAYMEDSNAAVVLTTAANAERARQILPPSGRVVDIAAAQAPNGGVASLIGWCAAEDPAYVIFTSGSTGRPKGCVLPHRALMDHLQGVAEYYGMGPGDASLLTITINFDPHLMQALSPLAVGGRLVICRPEGHADGDHITDLIARYGVTHFNSTPSLGFVQFAGKSVHLCCSVKCLMFGGEAMPPELIATLVKSMPSATVYNVYGPTEATITATILACPPDVEFISIGRPEANMHAYVVDAHLRPMPVGVPGELLLSGPRLALGYIGRPDLTADKFIPNPCLDLVKADVLPSMLQYYQKAYRTGDLVRWRPDGTIDFLGRIDRQVKINGVRIELGEVEAALAGTPGVEQAVASAVPDATGSKRLVGYVVPATAAPAAVIAHCRTLLVPAMVPGVVVALESWPMLPGGKIDVKALPTPDWSTEGAEEYEGPATDMEAIVQKICSEVLSRAEDNPLSVMADFFAAGGTSLQVFRVTAALEKKLGLASVPATLLHTERTVRGAAAALLVLRESGDAAVQQPIPACTWTGAERPLSSNQEQMWLLSHNVGSSAYNMPSCVVLARAPDVVALQTALDLVAARHEVLRMHYSQRDDGTVVGLVTPAAEFRVPLVVVAVASEAEQEAELNTEAAAPFNLSTGPLLRARLVKRAGQQPVALVLTMHHAVGDAWSMGLLQQELSLAYAAAVEGRRPLWEVLPIQYGDYAAWQQKQVAGEAGQKLKQWWKEYLLAAPSLLQLPQDRPRPAHPNFTAGQLSMELPSGLLAQVAELARELKVNAQAVVLAALQAVLLRYSGQDEVMVGVPVAGRDRPETQALVGYFINTLPVRCIATDDLAFAELAKQASKATVDALAHSALPLEQVVAAAGVKRAAGINPLFQVLLQYMPETSGPEGTDPSFLGIPVLPTPAGTAGTAHAKMDLVMSLGDGKLTADYMSELFDESTVARLLGSYVTVLQQAVAWPQGPALAGNMLSAADQQVVTRFSCGPLRMEYYEAPLFQDAVAAHAARAGGAPCLTFRGETLSYAEVEARVAALAARLVSLGTDVGTAVGLMLERSFELMIGMLAVMRAGGAYVPCDPGYPDDRLQVYLEDGGAHLLVTTRALAERAQNLAPADRELQPVYMDEVYEAPKGAAAKLPKAGLDNLCYIEFTSGSTGRPKGVMVPHLGLRDYSCFLREKFSLTVHDVSILTIPINFDPHVMQYSAALFNGGRLVIAEQDQHLNPESVMSLIAHEGVTFLNSVPVLGREYFSTLEAGQCAKLRIIMFAGEPLPKELVEMVAKTIGKDTVNGYGPTEATVTIIHAICTPADPVVTIGRVDMNSHAYIVDSRMQAVPVGVPGELLLCGPRLVTGYIGRPDLTADKFIPNPCFNMVKDMVPPSVLGHYQMAYRTGDLVRWRPDGTIEYLGRIDRQVKITGVRIELGEVEVALASAPGVEQAMANAILDDRGTKRLVGYVTPANADPAAVVAHCRSLLVPAMVPSVVVELEAFPLLPNGKTDVKALPVPDWTGVSGDEYVEPSNELEAAIQAIWMDALGTSEPVSTTADYFAIGGTSLKAAIVNANVRKFLELNMLQATLLYDHPTIQSYAAAITKFEEGVTSGEQTLLRSVTRKGLGQTTKNLLMRSKSMLAESGVAQLAAESVNLQRQLPHPVKPTALPYPAYLALQLLFSSAVTALVPAVYVIFVLLALLVWSAGGSGTLIIAGPMLYGAMLSALAGVLVLTKHALFPNGMRPGLYPVHGWTYLRWLAYRGVHDAVMGVLEPHIRRTPLMVLLLQLMGAIVEEDAIIDSGKVYEPDLLVIGSETILAEGASVSAAFVAPAGFLDPDVPCLVFTTTRAGHNCVLGRLSTLSPGGRLPNGHSLRPYAAVNQPNGLVRGDMADSYPHFYGEAHLPKEEAGLAAVYSFLFAYACFLPAALIASNAFAVLTGVSGADVLEVVGAALRGTSSRWALITLPLAAIVINKLLLESLATLVTTWATVAYKRFILGPLKPGMDLLASDILLFKHCLFKRLVANHFFSLLSSARAMGARVHPSSVAGGMVSLKGGLVEMDALTVGEGASIGGQVAYKAVSADGVIEEIAVGRFVACGHTTFFGGSSVGDGCQLGNETSVQWDMAVKPLHQLQGDKCFRMTASAVPPPAAASAEEPKDSLAVLLAFHLKVGVVSFVLPCINEVFVWTPTVLVGAALAALSGGGLALAIVAALATPVLGLVHAIACVLLAHMAGLAVGIQRVMASGGCDMKDPRYNVANSALIGTFSAAWDSFQGSPFYSAALSLLGARIHPSAIVFASVPMVELHLLTVGARCVLDIGAKVVPHFVQRGAYVFREVRLPDNVWVQGPSRMLTPKRVAPAARVLPGSMVLPDEEVAGVWAGVPAAPVTN